MRMRFIFASRADMTTRACASAWNRPSISSIGTIFAPRAKNGAPLIRYRNDRPPLPSAFLFAETYAGSVSFPVTSAKKRNPKRRLALTSLDFVESDAVSVYNQGLLIVTAVGHH